MYLHPRDTVFLGPTKSILNSSPAQLDHGCDPQDQTGGDDEKLDTPKNASRDLQHIHIGRGSPTTLTVAMYSHTEVAIVANAPRRSRQLRCRSLIPNDNPFLSHKV